MKEKVKGQQTALIFNAALTAACVAAAAELGVFDELELNSVLSIPEFCVAHHLHQPSLTSIIKMLASFSIINLVGDGSRVNCGPAFDEFRRESGPFAWLFQGTGRLLDSLADFTRMENRPANAASINFLQRDGARVARASAACSRFVDPYIEEALDKQPFKKVIDLGCGAAARLIHLATTRGCEGVGVEVNPAAVNYARQTIHEQGLENRITVVHADVSRLDPHAAFADADLMMMFFMGHDLWPAEDCARVLIRLREVAPNCRRFLLCDTVLSQASPSPEIPAFTNGFELTHNVMAKQVPTLDQWLELFDSTGWMCMRYDPIGVPYSYIFDLTSKE